MNRVDLDKPKPTIYKADCPFCKMPHHRVLVELETWIVVKDLYPVSKGHLLFIPKRHIEHIQYLTGKDFIALKSLINDCIEAVEDLYHADGFNIGFNLGKQAGQTVKHLHMHLIPRYEGDVDTPEGGIRGVIPDKQTYSDV